MRTTIEISEEQRAELLKLAAQRGLKGFSQIVKEALDTYLRGIREKREVINAALSLKGAFTGKDAEDFERRVSEVRKVWR
ncbi:MAG: ribbon-helix-helix protein, CopG family [Deltaproteobacteria bacterium]|nr:ribbon-helix-helix protein, CopG family [Deltaproteobacteria bacterium]MBI3294837.1 ribbon-helix-helix protein, CopG family [Deltaproteobacteria bacterium]